MTLLLLRKSSVLNGSRVALDIRSVETCRVLGRKYSNASFGQIDVTAAATEGWIDRSELSRQISGWEISGEHSYILEHVKSNVICLSIGYISSKGSQVRAVSYESNTDQRNTDVATCLHSDTQ